MTAMYDAVRPLIPNIPKNAPAVAGYIDGVDLADRWRDQDFAAFPNATHVRIAVLASTNDGHVLDIENGDASPNQAAEWVRMRIGSGLPRATLYTSQSVWPFVKADIAGAGLERVVDYWIADPTGKLHVLPGTVGTQWGWIKDSQGHSLYDVSEMLPTWWLLNPKGAQMPNAKCVAFQPTKSGEGYWLVGSDGGVFTFGDAKFFGSLGGKTLNAPIMEFATTPDEGGYWLVAEDYGVFTFGNASYHGHP